ncbi:hypothetical protein GP486_002028 [Trichoglossum hirsutum]|uniref:Heterokaryon incompatibility domain-containing protein n=1 Tax=Trichoglossum hirsutum TaxID=265104 RepID=A0A9P8RS54_9PEZI|nr:hypothetical protein GP486_002028 [Trichoglossum hirsutum]
MASQVYLSPLSVRRILFHLLGPEEHYAGNSNREEALIYNLMRVIRGKIGIPPPSFGVMFILFLSELRHSWLRTRFGGDFTITSNRYSSAVFRLLAAAILNGMVLGLRARLLRWIKLKNTVAHGPERAMRSDMFELILGSVCTWLAAKATETIENCVFRFALQRSMSKLIPEKEPHERHYRYEQLDSRNIRLLEMRRIKLLGRKNSFRLITVSLDSLPKYNAISYTWDSQPQDYFLDIDGQTLPVTENIVIILGTLNSFWTSKLFWIDQICINQQDTEEKTAQVQLMCEVYSKATSVIAWLSPFISNDMAYESPPEWLLCNTRPEKSICDLGSRPFDPLEVRGNSEHSALHPPKDLVQFILSHRLWWRLWIVQEIALAQDLTIVSLNCQINWNQLCTFVRQNEVLSYETLVHPTENINHPISYGVSPNLALSVRSLQGIRQIRMLADIREMVQHESHTGFSSRAPRGYTLVESLSSPWGFLNKTASSLCFDKRDKLFGLYGVLEMISRNKCTNGTAPQQDRHGDNELYQSFIPNYSKSAHEIFLQVTRACIERGEEVDPLRWAGSGWYRNIKSLPTWVTDWSTIPDTLIHGFESYPGSYQVGGICHCPEKAYSIVGRLVRVHGALDIGRIVALTSVVNHDYSFSNKRSWFIREWLREAVEMLANAPQSFHESHGLYRVVCFDSKCECRDETLWRTLVADMYICVADEALEWGRHCGAIDRRFLNRVLLKPQSQRLFVTCQRPAPRDLRESFAAWSVFPDKCQKAETTGEPISSEVVTHATRFSLASRAHTQGRRLALTEYGHLCLVPPLAQIGDIVCAFENIRIPYIIRDRKKTTRQQSQSKEPVFELVGQCYAHGIMTGERSILEASNWEQRKPIFLK